MRRIPSPISLVPLALAAAVGCGSQTPANVRTISGQLAPSAYLLNNAVIVARSTDNHTFVTPIQGDLSFAISVPAPATYELLLANSTTAGKYRTISQIRLPTASGPAQWATLSGGGQTSLGTVKPDDQTTGGAGCFPGMAGHGNSGCMGGSHSGSNGSGSDDGSNGGIGGGFSFDAGFSGFGGSSGFGSGFSFDAGLGGFGGSSGFGGNPGGGSNPFADAGSGGSFGGSFSFDGGFGSGSFSFDGGFPGCSHEDDGLIACGAADQTNSQGSVSLDLSATSAQGSASLSLSASWDDACCNGVDGGTTSDAGSSGSLDLSASGPGGSASLSLEFDNSDGMQVACGCGSFGDDGSFSLALSASGPGGSASLALSGDFAGVGNAGPCPPTGVTPPVCGPSGTGASDAGSAPSGSSDAGTPPTGAACNVNSDCTNGLICVASTCQQPVN